MTESEGMQTLLMKVKEESEKVGWKLKIQKTKTMTFGPITLWQIDGETMEILIYFISLSSKITADDDCSHENKIHLLLGRKAMKYLNKHFKKQRLLCQQSPSSQSNGFPVVMYGCESWLEKKLSANELVILKSGVREDSWESLDSKEMQPVHPKENQSWIFFGRTDAEAETPILWPPDAKNWLIGKDPDAGKDWRQEDKGMTEDEMVGWHHPVNGHDFIGSRSWWWTGKSRVLQSMGSPRVGHNWASELN